MKNGDYITAKEAAELLGISVQAVYKKFATKFEKVDNLKKIKKSLIIGENEKTVKPQIDNQINNLLTTLDNQLKAKDSQIEALQEQLKTKDSQIETLTLLLQGQSVLIKQQLDTTDRLTTAEESKPKRLGLFKRWRSEKH